VHVLNDSLPWFNRYNGNNFDLSITGYAPDEITRLESFHTDILEVGTKYTTRFTAFFTPRVTGNHTFWSQTDDMADVWVSEVEAGGTAPAAAGTAPGVVGRCRLTISNPELKVRLVSALETRGGAG